MYKMIGVGRLRKTGVEMKRKDRETNAREESGETALDICYLRVCLLMVRI